MVVWEATRPLVEIQSAGGSLMMSNPRAKLRWGWNRNWSGDPAAALHRHGGLQMADCDVFVNVVGGVKVTETSADLALLLAMVSSLRDRPLPQDLVVRRYGWLGKFRPVPSGRAYLRSGEAWLPPRYVPAANAGKSAGRHANLLREKAFRRAKRF